MLEVRVKNKNILRNMIWFNFKKKSIPDSWYPGSGFFSLSFPVKYNIAVDSNTGKLYKCT